MEFYLLKVFWKDFLSAEQLCDPLNTVYFYPYTVSFSFVSKQDKYDAIIFNVFIVRTLRYLQTSQSCVFH